mmetsp:Transcript_17495/g.34394  ORF Transcript_17495/g.34394 Transcript_17495/m.34394 type:complete len:492 (-) Transcript_17495:100-1575(-)
MAANGDSGRALLRKAYAEDNAYAPSAPGWGGSGFETAEVVASATSYDPSAPVATAAPFNPFGSGNNSGNNANNWGASSSSGNYGGYSGVESHSQIPAAIGFDGGFPSRQTFERYDEVVNGIQNLQHVDNDIKVSNQQIGQCKQRLDDVQRKLHKARKDLPKAEARLDRNAHPRFFHYMQINRQEKVQRLTKMVEDIKVSEEQLVGDKHQRESELKKAQEELQRLRGIEANRDALRSERQDTFDKVVASTAPTPRLQQIRANISAQTSALQAEQSLLTQVNEVLSLVRQAQQLYAQSMQMLQRAANANQTAQVTNIVGFGDRRGGMEFFETMNQLERDQLINNSQRPAEQAYQLISQAWQMFPQEVRRRYPSMTAQIGHVPLPKLRGAHFGNTLAAGFVFGDIGDAINNGMATGKIRENMGILQQCNMIVDQQVALVVALRNTINMDVDKMSGNLDALDQQQAQEREFIFANVRSRFMGSSGASMGYATSYR